MKDSYMYEPSEAPLQVYFEVFSTRPISLTLRALKKELIHADGTILRAIKKMRVKNVNSRTFIRVECKRICSVKTQSELKYLDVRTILDK